MEFVILPLSTVMSNAKKNMQFTPANFQQTSHNDVMLTIQKIVKLKIRMYLTYPLCQLPNTWMKSNFSHLQISTLSFVFQEATQNSYIF